MDSTILQIPMSKSLKKSSQEVANEYGFSSLQELLRVVLTKLSKRELIVSISQPEIKVSSGNSARYRKMAGNFTEGKNVKSFDSIQDLIHDLHT